MIRFSLRCADGHAFDSWFASNAAFDTVRKAGMAACPECGDTRIEKALMAPAVRPTPEAPAPARAAPGPRLSEPETPRHAALAKLRAEIEKRSEDVGARFASEARAMHAGEAPARSIYGQARPEEARALIEDGVPIAPLPFVPRSRAN